MDKLLTSNSAAYRTLRTIIQGVIGAILAYLSIAAANAPEIVAMLIIPVAMAILSPIMGMMGESIEKDTDHKVGGSE